MPKLTKRNLLFVGASILLIAIGYYLLGQGSMTVAPILLILGYLIFLPLSIIL